MAEKVVTAALVVVTAALGTPVLASSVETLDFSTQYGAYLEPVTAHMPLLMALFGVVFVATVLTDKT